MHVNEEKSQRRADLIVFEQEMIPKVDLSMIVRYYNGVSLGLFGSFYALLVFKRVNNKVKLQAN